MRPYGTQNGVSFDHFACNTIPDLKWQKPSALVRRRRNNLMLEASTAYRKLAEAAKLQGWPRSGQLNIARPFKAGRKGDVINPVAGSDG